MATKIFSLCSVVILIFVSYVYSERSFTVDYENDTFVKDGKPFRYVSGSLHYFRVPQQYWKDRMIKMKAAGLNALQTYVEWRGHEPELGVYNFKDNYDIVNFLKTANEVGLLVIFRPGPYICAERDFGGLPYWLASIEKSIIARTSDQIYLSYVDKWFNVLLPMIRPFLYENGGPIITVQVENEYGQFYSCDFEYMSHLRDLIRSLLGSNVILFRTDIPDAKYYKCDNIDGTLVTADFGAGENVQEAFHQIRLFEPKGPLVVTEYYPGWMDHWGSPHANSNITQICETLDEILKANASVNFYMFHGGTNFGFSNGANEPFSPQPTSYDYHAPLSESGDVTPNFFAIRKVIGKYFPLPPGPVPQPSPKLALGKIPVTFLSSLFDSLPYIRIRNTIISESPKSFEELRLGNGFCMYSAYANITPTDPAVLNVPGLKDRGYVFVDEEFRGILRRPDILSLPLQLRRNQLVTILVENQGRLNSGSTDLKGITSDVTIDSHKITNWVMDPIPLNNSKNIENIPKSIDESSFKVPGFFNSSFVLPKNKEPMDTFLDPTGWNKGVAFLNGFNLGRYWPVVGPQVTLYVPGILLKPYPKVNNLIIFELEKSPCEQTGTCTIELTDTPYLNGEVPSD